MAIEIKEGFKFLKGDIKIHPTTGITLEYLEKSDAVCLILFNKNLDKVLLVEQYRPGVDKNTFENIAGLIDEGEDPFEAVKRELKEETGYNYEDLENLISMPKPLSVSPGYTTEKLYFYAANLKSDSILPGNTNFDEGEDIKTHFIDINDVIDLETDMKTILSIQYFLPILEDLTYNRDKKMLN